jgi:glyceraldehyde-3-phosphate dehydrogenase/erythrose-4-phosphate dehydrogenase
VVVGAGRIGARVLLQLQKNPEIEVLTVDPRDQPYAVQRRIIAAVDYHEALTPQTIEHVIQQTKPDLVLVTTSTEDMELGQAPGVDILVEALRREIAATARVPVIGVARAVG